MKAVCAGNPDDRRARLLAKRLSLPLLEVEWHRYPDGESGVRVMAKVPDEVIVFADLVDPDSRFLPLVFLLDLLRELGAQHLTLVAPYLPYLRQDARFRDGEAITSRTFATLLSPGVDRLVTIDPHLHRYHSLREIYEVDDVVLSAAEDVGDWLRAHIETPLLVGPDSESVQWVKRAADRAKAPCVILQKKRHGDRDVEISLPEISDTQRTPVLVDDIVSSGHTMAEATRALLARGFPAPVCVAVHAINAEGALELLEAAGARRLVTTNTVIDHAEIDIFDRLAAALR